MEFKVHLSEYLVFMYILRLYQPSFPKNSSINLTQCIDVMIV